MHEPHNVVENVLKDDIEQTWRALQAEVDLTCANHQVPAGFQGNQAALILDRSCRGSDMTDCTADKCVAGPGMLRVGGGPVAWGVWPSRDRDLCVKCAR